MGHPSLSSKATTSPTAARAPAPGLRDSPGNWSQPRWPAGPTPDSASALAGLRPRLRRGAVRTVGWHGVHGPRFPGQRGRGLRRLGLAGAGLGAARVGATRLVETSRLCGSRLETEVLQRAGLPRPAPASGHSPQGTPPPGAGLVSPVPLRDGGAPAQGTLARGSGVCRPTVSCPTSQCCRPPARLCHTAVTLRSRHRGAFLGARRGAPIHSRGKTCTSRWGTRGQPLQAPVVSRTLCGVLGHSVSPGPFH